jgi:hypothetical protein
MFNTLSDIAHKIFSPATYACNLCKITYGNFQVKEEWKQFIDSLDAELEFIHRDEFVSGYGMKDVSLPAIFLKQDGKLVEWIDAEKINACETIDALKQVIVQNLEELK